MIYANTRLFLLMMLNSALLTLSLERLMPKPDEYIILLYHHISAKESPYSVSPTLFKKQIKFLKEEFDIVKLSDVKKDRGFQGKKVIITFDDGYQDIYTNAYKIIKEHNIPITIFLISGRIGKKGYLNWNQINELKKSGLVEFGNHSRNHRALDKLNADELKSEIAGADKDLRNKLGKIKYFSYPFGDRYDKRAVKLLKKLEYKYCLTWVTGINDKGTDPYQLKRISINGLDFKNKLKLRYASIYFKVFKKK